MSKNNLSVLFVAVCSISTNLFADGDPVLGKTKAFDCEACHSPDNLQMNPIWPTLSGQNAGYLAKQIRDYQTGLRKHGVMQQMVAKLDDVDISDITQFYSDRAATINSKDVTTNSVGERIYKKGFTSSGAPACVDCHGTDGRSNVAGGFVALVGQQKMYIENQLYAFKYGDRVNDSSGLMQKSVKQLKDSDIESVSEYITSLKGSGSKQKF